MFGRAGRPQFDDRGYVFALPHEDDVKILRWKEKFDQIPEDTKDPGLRKAKKALKKKQPKRREGQQYWSESQFQQLIEAPSADLASRGPLSWRLLVYMLDVSPEVERIRKLVRGRLLKPKEQETAQKQLNRMLLTLYRAGYVELEPKPNLTVPDSSASPTFVAPIAEEPEPTSLVLDLGQKLERKKEPAGTSNTKSEGTEKPAEAPVFAPELAKPTEAMEDLLLLRGVHPLYAVFLMNHLGIADQNERILAFESILELSRSIGKAIRVPDQEDLPPGPLQTTRLDSQLLKLGLATAEELGAGDDDDEDDRRGWYDEDYVPILTLPHKLHRLFQYDFPDVHDVRVWPVWVAGEVLRYGDDFNKYITSNKLQKQEGIVFRHLLRMILLLDEMAALCPPDVEHADWQDDLGDIADQLEAICRQVDPQSTDQWLASARTNEEQIADPGNG